MMITPHLMPQRLRDWSEWRALQFHDSPPMRSSFGVDHFAPDQPSTQARSTNISPRSNERCHLNAVKCK